MKKLFIVSMLSLSLMLSVFDPSSVAGANAAGQSKAKTSSQTKAKSTKKTNSKSTKKTNSKSTKKTNSKSTKKTNSKSTKKSNSKSTKKSNSKSTKKSNSKSTKKTNSKSTKKAKSANSRKAPSKKVASRGSYGSFDASRVISVGMSLKGTPYKYGGSSTKGFDCSGFTSYVFKKAAGISLPRTSGGQASAGTAVSRNELKPGDLVYFNTNGKGVSHVGIYIGEGNFIHASRTKGITVTSLSDSYYRPKYMGATRIK